MKPKPGFTVALYGGADEPQEITQSELLALRAFHLVAFDSGLPGRFYVPIGKEREVATFLNQWRMR